MTFLRFFALFAKKGPFFDVFFLFLEPSEPAYRFKQCTYPLTPPTSDFSIGTAINRVKHKQNSSKTNTNRMRILGFQEKTWLHIDENMKFHYPSLVFAARDLAGTWLWALHVWLLKACFWRCLMLLAPPGVSWRYLASSRAP